jgi:hypothetical protein
MKRENYILVYIIVLILVILVVLVLLYCYNNNLEYFTVLTRKDLDLGFPYTNHTVDLPINTTFECQNKCMPPAICSITGTQCMSDLDCCGCNPHAEEINRLIEQKNKDIKKPLKETDMVEGFTPKMKQTYPYYFTGIDTWTQSFNVGENYYDRTYNPKYAPEYKHRQHELIGQVHYPERRTLSGQFIENGAYTIND